jgi:serine/threonine-protein kinase
LLRKLQRSNYRLLGLVGQGQFGQVYCAIHRRTGRLVALKNLNRDRLTTHRFLRELRFLLSLEHPNIANCHALEQSANGRQLVLDYCEGGTLRQLMEQTTPLKLAEILTLMAEVLNALDHAHNQGIVHCDIKPENILLLIRPGAWAVKISDFGIARLSQELRGNDQTGATGSPAYMAPERFYHQHSASSDLYALGVILFEMLMGDRPFSGTPSQLMVAHLNKPAPIPDHLPIPIQTMLRKALQKLMARRYHTAGDMAAALKQLRGQLTAAELRTHYPLIYRETPIPTFSVPEGAPSLTAQVEGSAIAHFPPTDHLLLIQHQTQVQSWALPAAAALNVPAQTGRRWQLPEPVTAVFGAENRAIVATDNTLYELQHNGETRLRATFPTSVQVVMPPSLNWAIGYSEATQQLWWSRLWPKAVPPQPLPLPMLPTPKLRLLALENRHLLMAAPAGDETELHVITRRGKALGYLSLQTSIQTLALTQTPRRILAQEVGRLPSLLIIDLLPFRVLRCRLDVTTPWIGELEIGYAACSRQGELRIVNPQGQLIGSVNGLPHPQAIAFQYPYHLWVVDSGDPPALHRIDIRDLDLDIIF